MTHKLQDLIDMSLFQTMLDRLNELYPFPSAIVDVQGNILVANAWQDVCAKFHRLHPQAAMQCKISDQYISNHLQEANPSLIYSCPHGLVDCATPIIIEGEHLGNLFAGQIFLEKPDTMYFRKQALHYGFDEPEYLKAVEKVPVLSRTQLEKYLELIGSLVKILVENGSDKLKKIEGQKIIQESEARFKSLFDAAPDAIFLADTETGIIIDANHAATKLLGRPASEIIGMHQSQLHPSRNEQFSKRTFRHHALGGKEPKEIPLVENLIVRVDGTEVPVEIMASTITINGKPIIQGIFRDITLRKQVEANLSASERNYRTLAENLPDVIARFDKDLRYTYVNPVIQQITGFPDKAFIGKTNEDLQMPPEIICLWNEKLHKVFEEGEQHIFEFTFQANNLLRYFSALLVPEFGANGKVDTVLSVARDITSIKKSENILKVQHDYGILLSHISDLNMALTRLVDYVFQLDGIDCGSIHLINQSSGSIDLIVSSGLSEQFVSQISHFPSDSSRAAILNYGLPVYRTYQEIITSNILSIIQEGLRSYSVIPILHNGKAIASLNLASKLYDEIPADTRIALESIASNLGGTISRIQAEKKLQESEEKYKLAFKTSPDSININRLDGVYVEINDGFTSLMGYTKEEIIGRSSKELNIWAIPKDREKLIEGLRKEGKVENLESVFQSKDGFLRTALMSATLIPINNEPHILSITRDITDRKKVETELVLAKEKAEESDRLKTAFLANMSHELRTPMNGILGFADLLADESLSNEERSEYLRVINDSGQSLLDVITNIVDISKIDSNQIGLRIRPFSLNSLLDELMKWFSSEKIIKDKSHLHVEIEKPLPDEQCIITSDQVKIRHVFSLLLNNSAKFTSEGFIRFGYSVQKQSVRFFVQDSGKGIRAEKQASIFERFRQEDETLSRKYGGIGLGLTIAKGLVELMEGQIGVDSEVGKGSTFWFEVPLLETNESQL